MSESDTAERLQGAPLVLATIAVAAASFMNVLDTTIAIVALPTISGNLGATPSQGAWIITSYSVCLAVVLPLSGWITRRFGEVHTFCVAILLFTLTSWLCSAATSFNQLLLFRALQGFSGGLLLPLSQSLLMRMYPPEKQGLALGLWGITSAAAPVLGPVLGGILTDRFGWPWIFLINVPIGLSACYICWTLLRPFETRTERVPVDIVGLLLLLVGVICFQLVLDRGHELDWLSSRQIQVMLGVSVLFFFLFLAWERGEEHPVVDLSLFGYRNFVLGSAMISILYMTFVVSMVLYPTWMQTSLGYTATWSGLAMAPMGLGPLLLMPLIGQRLRNWDVRKTVAFGLVLFFTAFYFHAQTSTDTTASYMASLRFFTGLAMPFSWMPLMVVALVGLPPDKLASAAGIFNFIRMLASSMGTAVGVTLWDQRSTFHHSRLVESLAADSPQYQQATDLLSQRLADEKAVMAALDRAVTVQARTLGMDDIFYLSAAVLVPLLLLAWFLPASAATAEEST